MQIVRKPEDQSCWVVRASGGDFVSHFRQANVMAIGHLDVLDLRSTNKKPFYPELLPIRKALEKAERKENVNGYKYRASSHFHQAKTFISEISIGDLVVTVDHKKLSIGRVIGHPYISKRAVRYIYDEATGRHSDMPFNLRREVQWGPVMDRGTLPLAMKRTITARQTVFNIDEYWTAIYHLLYPIFFSDDNVFFSTRIRKKEEIDTFNVGQFFRILTELEIVVEAYKEILANPDVDFDTLFEEYLISDEHNLKTIAEFMSPGSIWSRLGVNKSTGSTIVLGSLLYGAMFGIDVKAWGTELHTDGILDKESRQAIVNYFLTRLEENHSEKIKERLKLDVPKYNTKPLEDDSKDAKKDNRGLEVLINYENSI